jgi:DNA-directed RNA polymerase specialized sigma24 family protein
MATKKPDWLSEELMGKVSKYARKICMAKGNFSDMEDTKQDLLYDLCKAMKCYDSPRGDRNAFLEGVLRNRVKMYVRAAFAKKSGKGMNFELFDDDYHRETNDSPEEEILTARIDLSNAADRLSWGQFQIYTLLKNYSTAEVARLLRLPYSSLHLKMRKIHEKIRQSMESPNIFVVERGVNMKDLSLLENMSAKEISALNTSDLMDLNAQATEMSAKIKKIKEKLDDGMHLKFHDLVMTGLKMAAKDTGTIRFYEGTLQIVAEVPKKVTWNMEKMDEIVKRIPEDIRKTFVKTSYAIEERKYTSLPSAYQDLFKEARTVTPGKIRFQISNGDNQ